MNKYRTHNCNELRKDDLEKDILISGWINKRKKPIDFKIIKEALGE